MRVPRSHSRNSLRSASPHSPRFVSASSSDEEDDTPPLARAGRGEGSGGGSSTRPAPFKYLDDDEEEEEERGYETDDRVERFHSLTPPPFHTPSANDPSPPPRRCRR